MQRMFLGYLWGGEKAVVSRGTAAWVWGIAPWKDPVDITLSIRRDTPARWVSVHRCNLEPYDVGKKRGTRVCNATRVLIDLAGELDERSLELMLDDALRRGATSVPRLRWRLDQCRRGQVGSGALRRLLEARLVGGLSESTLETLMGRVLKGMEARGFPLPQRQFVVRLDGLGGTARLDFAFPEFKVGLEGDGRRWHGQGRWEEDLRRENAFRQAGWDVRRFSWRDVARDPAYVLEQAEAALRLAGWRRPAQGTLS
ncbi:MAG: DUF559 domain-containing protein [Actinobacteria bacterium]|nr:DUF559 domain-containing protein [Actinomycetota bacterium]